MASNFNSEFNYRYQVLGNTPWEKLKHLQNFLEGRKRARALEEIGNIKLESKREEIKYLKENNGLLHVILALQAEVMEIESTAEDLTRIYKLNHAEIAILEKLMAELYVELEPTRLRHEDGTPYSDDEMFEANANNDFTMTVVRELQAEMIAMGRPSPAKLLNAMSNPQTLQAIISVGLIPEGTRLIQPEDLPLQLTASYGQPAKLLSSGQTNQLTDQSNG